MRKLYSHVWKLRDNVLLCVLVPNEWFWIRGLILYSTFIRRPRGFSDFHRIHMHEKAFLNSLRPSTRNILSGVFKNSPDTVYVWMEGKSATKYLCIRQTNLYNVNGRWYDRWILETSIFTAAIFNHLLDLSRCNNLQTQYVLRFYRTLNK